MFVLKNFPKKNLCLNKKFSQEMALKSPILKGIRVLDLSRILVGPLSSMILSDLGAEVIKIESFDGDETRKWGPPFNKGSSTYYLSINRNKKSLCLNLKNPSGLSVLYDLVKKSDIFLENFSSSVPKALKIDYETLKTMNPRLIYGSVTGYGKTGPLAQNPGFDATIQSFSGLMHITGQPDGEPTRVGVAITDVLTGQMLTNGILAGLYQREKTGEGVYVRTSLLETALSSLVNITSAYLNGGISPQRIGNHHPSIVPYGTYKVKGGKYITIACGTDGQFQAFMKILGLSDLKGFETNKERVVKRKELNSILNVALESLELNELVKRLNESKIPAAPLNDIPAALENEQVKALGTVKEVRESKNHENVKLVKSPLNFEGFEEGPFEEPPVLNENAEEILKKILGYSDNKIQDLIKEKAILKGNFPKI